jgi:hypothetical protein
MVLIVNFEILVKRMEYITKDHQGCQSKRPCCKKQK